MTPRMLPADLRNILRLRAIAKRKREAGQGDLISPEELWQETMIGKLRRTMPGEALWQFMRCGVEQMFRVCCACGSTRAGWYHCDRRWCPRCQKRLAARRAATIGIWIQHVTQPKHLVLTKRNFEELHPKDLRTFAKSLTKFRRSKCFREVHGGCQSIEMTHEGRGWHMHAHMLLDVKWLDMGAVEATWASLMKQQNVIVKIKDVRGGSYVQEVSKYVAKGSEMAGWPAERLAAFIAAIRGTRFFAPFGSLLKQGAEIRAEIARAKGVAPACECGCEKFLWETADEREAREISEQHGQYHRRHRLRG